MSPPFPCRPWVGVDDPSGNAGIPAAGSSSGVCTWGVAPPAPLEGFGGVPALPPVLVILQV